MERYYSNGKLLLTGEYLVLDGAHALAVPTVFGQDLTVEPINDPLLIWGSFTADGTCWFEAQFELPKLRLLSATFDSSREGSSEFIAETLQNILQEARKLNPAFLNSDQGCLVKTHLTFPRNWGLGSSSTLINNIATWAKVDAFKLLWNAFSGSGYDIACAQNNNPIRYKLTGEQDPSTTEVSYRPEFADTLFFVFLNQKQNSREGIARYKEKRHEIQRHLTTVDALTEAFIQAKNVDELSEVITEHETLIGNIIQQPTVKERLFTDYHGAVKSLGAWGGDFVLATGDSTSVSYFKEKGYTTVIPYTKMILGYE